MKRRVLGVTATIAGALAIAAIAYQLGNADGLAGRTLRIIETSTAAEEPSKISPVKARDRDFYAPNSEDLGPDEMRLIACGTGMPTPRPKQAASCWLLELGNGDKFLFDV